MKTEDAVNLAIESIKAAIEWDVFSGGKKIDVAVITEKGIELLRHEITPNLSWLGWYLHNNLRLNL
jgi:20S proteasome alpha/beta subunit